MYPFAELTNADKTPSPAQKDDSFSRKHSPWTAARQKKKTRSVQQHQPSDAMPAYEHAVPEAYESPAANVKTGGVSAEFSLADVLSSGSHASASPHTSPPVTKGTAEDAEVHPSKAYILDPEAPTSLHGMDLGSAGGVDLAAAAAAAGSTGTSSRSPVWFCSNNPMHDMAEAPDAGDSSYRTLHACSSAPAGSNLFDKFDRVAQQQHRMQPDQQHLQRGHPQPSQLLHTSSQMQQQQQQHAAVAQAAPVVRARRLTARRGSWGGSEQLQRPNATSSVGSSRLAASSCGLMTGSSSLDFITHAQEGSAGDWQQPQQPALHQGAGSLHNIDTGFQLHSRLSHIDDSEFELQRSFGSGFLRQQHCGGWEREVDDWRCAGPSAGSAAGRDGDTLTGRIEAADGTLEWFEGLMQEAADDGDMPAAEQLWCSLQAAGLQPSRKFMNLFLMCCHHGGGDPLEAQEAVRDMCSVAEIEPDNLTTQLLAAIDIGWQQLHCGF